MEQAQEISIKQTFSSKIQSIAKTVAKECTKYYPPAANPVYDKNSKAASAAINVLCLQAMKFKQQNPFGFIGTVRMVKQIRKELKALNYDRAFVDSVSLFLIRALMRTPRIKK